MGPIEEKLTEHKDELDKLKELLLKLSQKLKTISEWKLEVGKDVPKLKKKMKIIFDEREKAEAELLDSIWRSSQDSARERDRIIIEPEKKVDILPALGKLQHKKQGGPQLKINLGNFEESNFFSPRNSTLPKLNFSPSRDILQSVRAQPFKGLEKNLSKKQLSVASKRKSMIPHLN